MKPRSLLLTALAIGAVAGCATVPKTAQEDEVAILKGRVAVLTERIAAYDAALAKDGKYMVRAGDTLSKIAATNGVDVKDLMEMNADLLGGRPWLRVGMLIRIKKE